MSESGDCNRPAILFPIWFSENCISGVMFIPNPGDIIPGDVMGDSPIVPMDPIDIIPLFIIPGDCRKACMLSF